MVLVIVGDVFDELSTFACEIDQHAKLLNKNNFSKLCPGTYYTALGEFDSYNQFTDALDQADNIIYHPPHRWSDTNSSGISLMKKYTEIALVYFHNRKPVDNFVINHFDTQTILDLADVRKSNSPQIWVAGGSDSHGYAIDPSARYGILLSEYFKMEVSFLTAPAASMRWIADQILRSDIRAGDLLIFGVVPDCRVSHYYKKQEYHVTPVTYNFKDYAFLKDFFSPDLLGSDEVALYQTLNSLYQIINLCDKLNVHLIIAGLSPMLITNHLLKFSNYVHLINRHYSIEYFYLDQANDGEHPGPLTHKYYAEEIIAKIKQLDINLC